MEKEKKSVTGSGSTGESVVPQASVTGVMVFLVVVFVIGLGFFLYARSSDQNTLTGASPTEELLQPTSAFLGSLTVGPSPRLISTVTIAPAMTTAPTNSMVTPPAIEEPSDILVPEDEVTVIDLIGQNFEFSQPEIRVQRGRRVQINFMSAGGMHDLVIDEFGVSSERVNTDESTMVEFLADTQGVYAFYCSVGNHRASGMEGTLVVE